MIPVSKYPQNLQDEYSIEIADISRKETDNLISKGYTEDKDLEDYIYNYTCYNLSLKELTEAETLQETASGAGASSTEREQSDMWRLRVKNYKEEMDRLFPMLTQTTSNVRTTPAFQQI